MFSNVRSKAPIYMFYPAQVTKRNLKSSSVNFPRASVEPPIVLQETKLVRSVPICGNHLDNTI